MTTYLAQYNPKKNMFKILGALPSDIVPMLSQEQLDTGMLYLTEKDLDIINPANIELLERLNIVKKN